MLFLTILLIVFCYAVIACAVRKVLLLRHYDDESAKLTAVFWPVVALANAIVISASALYSVMDRSVDWLIVTADTIRNRCFKKK